MKIVSSEIKEFIEDFKLEQAELICFIAILYFSNDRHSVKIESEVHILSIIPKHVDVVYLLNPQVNDLGMPDMYDDETNSVTYKKNTCLVIKGQSASSGKYILSVHPNGTYCTPQTLQEIHQKQFN